MSRLETQPRISIFGDYDYEDDRRSDVENEEQSEKTAQKDGPSWDSFKTFPTKRYVGSTQDTRCVEFTIRLLKLFIYLLNFCVVLVAGVIAKSTLLLAVSQLGQDRLVHLRLTDSEFQQYVSKLSAEGKAIWIWCLILMFMVPELLSVLRAIWRLIFKKKQRKPKKLSLAVFFLLEGLHSFGLALLLFIALPQLDSVEAAALSTCLCFIPALLALLSQNRGEGLISRKTFTLIIFFDLLAFAAQVGGLFLSFVKHNIASSWIFPLALVLASCRWWSNYVSEHSYIGVMRFLAMIKKDLWPSRLIYHGYASVWRIIVFVTTATVVATSKGITVKDFFRVLRKERYVIDLIPTTNSKVQEFLYRFRNDLMKEGEASVLLAETGEAIRAFIVQAGCAFLVYQVAKFSYRTHMHRFGFALPISLITPLTVILLTSISLIKKGNPWTFYNIIPDYLFFQDGNYNNVKEIVSDWRMWCSILFYLSQIWITVHIWYSKCERMALVENIFYASVYDSTMIDLFLALNKIKREDEMAGDEEDFLDSLADVQVAGSKEMLEIKDKKEGIAMEEVTAIKKNNCVTQIYACATMWHETKEEMNELVGSILRLDRDQCAMRVTQKYYKISIEDYYELETHVFFDDAFRCMHGCSNSCCHDENETQVNEYVMTLVETVRRNIESLCMRSSPPIKYPTPYGGRLLWILPGKTRLVVHLKDKNKIRHRKRWSQVMYMYYLLGYRLMGLPIDVDKKEQVAENTYILTLDGDIDFQPAAVKVLVDLMKKDKDLGAACGRIHPIGKGPMIWFQKFEYAIGHWLQKSTEHTIGCVLCSPGCFSLFRAKTLMQYNVMAKYATKSTEARHYVQYDQGEDRWLCTLILQIGCRVEYSAASDAYTHAPEAFPDFYIQRKRWIPSTVANIFDLLNTAKETREVNDDISWLYVFYLWVLMGSTILGPGTIFLMMVGAFVSAFRIDNWTSFWYNLIPISIFVAVCAFCKEKVQLIVAQIITAFYGLVMIIVLVGIMLQIAEDGWLAPSSLLFFVVAMQLIIAGLLHPQEWSCLLCGLVYYVTVPSMYMLLIIFSIFNVHNVTWGTRESKKPTNTETQAENKNSKTAEENKAEKGQIEFSLWNMFRCVLCTHESGNKEEKYLDSIYNSINKINLRLEQIESNYRTRDVQTQITEDPELETTTNEPESFIYQESEPEIEDLTNIHETTKDQSNFLISPYWLQDERMRHGEVDFLSNLEEEFWKSLIEKYLHPIDNDEEKQTKLAEDLMNLRSEYLFKFFMINSLFILIVFLMQLNKDVLHLQWPLGVKHNITYNEEIHVVHLSKEYLRLEPIGFVFIIGFVLILIIQFSAMLVHRFDTFAHILANARLNLRCCKKKSIKRIIESRHAEDIARGLQRAVEDETVFRMRRNSDLARSRRKTIRELTMDAQNEPRTMSNFETLFRRKLGDPVSGLLRLVSSRDTVEALERRRTEILRDRGSQSANHIYDHIDNYGSSIYGTRSRERESMYYDYDNLAYQEDADKRH